MKNLSLKQLAAILALLPVVMGIIISAGISYLSTKNQLIESGWNQFQADFTEKVRLKNALDSALGYGGMIHHYKNLVIRKKIDQVDRVNNGIISSRMILDQYNSLVLNESELTAIYDIGVTLDHYSQALKNIETLINNGRSAEEIDSLARVDDAIAFRGLIILRDENIAYRKQFDRGKGKALFLGELRRHLGYGGMIHAFKNYILRRDEKYFEEAGKSLAAALSEIDGYRQVGATSSELIALQDIETTIHTYESQLLAAKKLIDDGLTIEQIDQKVQVDDGLSLRGLGLLDHEINYGITAKAKGVSDAFDAINDAGYWILRVELMLIALMIVISLWVIYYYIASPIGFMAKAMFKLAEGDTSVDIDRLVGQNEVGRMAKAIAVFKENVLMRHEAEESLQLANAELVQQLGELQSMREASDEQAAKSMSLSKKLLVEHDLAVESTNRAKAEEERARAIINTVSDGIIVIDDDGAIKSFNPAAEDIFGYKESEVRDKNVNVLIPDPYNARHDAYIEKGMFRLSKNKLSMMSRREVSGLRKDGTIFPLEVTIGSSMVSGSPIITGMVRDISRQKMVDRMKGEFISTVSHELRTPLTSIKGALGLLSNEVTGVKLDGASSKLMDVARNNVDRLSRLVDDILDVEKLESGKFDFTFSSVHVARIVDDAISVNEHFAVKNDVTFTVSEYVEAMVFVDIDRIEQVMSNLLSNAAKYSPKGGNVGVGVTRTGDKIRFYVADNGPGVPDMFRDRMFDRFTQADGSDMRKPGSTGLGMAISKVIVEKHGGQIGFESEVGVGSTFYFDLEEYIELDKKSVVSG